MQGETYNELEDVWSEYQQIIDKTFLMPSPPVLSFGNLQKNMDPFTLQLLPKDIYELYPVSIHGNSNCLPRFIRPRWPIR